MVVAALTSFATRALVTGAAVAYRNRHAAIYAGVCIALFAVLYRAMDIRKHFTVPDYMVGQENHFLNSLYLSTLCQNNAMPGDMMPKTLLARALFMTQVCLGWLWFLLFVGDN